MSVYATGTWFIRGCGWPLFVLKQFHGKNIAHFFICFHRAQSFAERLRLGIAVIHGEAQDAESDLVDGRHSPPTVKNIGAIHPNFEIPCKNLTSENSLTLFYCFPSYSLSSSFFLFLHSANSQRKTPNNCGWRCRWTNCHHSGEFKMIGISSGQHCF